MKNTLIGFISILLLSSVVISKEYEFTKEIGRKDQSVYFEMSNGDLYHSSDFGFTFEKVNTDKPYVAIIDGQPSYKTNSKVNSLENKVNLSNNQLILDIDPSYNGVVNVVVTNLVGLSERFTFNSNTLKTPLFILQNKYNVAIVKLNFDGVIPQTFKFIN